MAFGTEQALQLLRAILKELETEISGTSGATAANQATQIILETAIKAVLDTINTNGSTGNTTLTAISNALTTLNSNIATSAKQDSQIALENPTKKYKISETDTTGASYYYFGFIDKDGGWYIMRQALTTSVLNTFTYVSGASLFATAWTGRTSQTYVTFDNAF